MQRNLSILYLLMTVRLSNDYIRNNFNIVQYRITQKLPFFFAFENEFIQYMLKIYQDLKAINQFKVDCEQKILNVAQLSWELLNGDDTVVV